MDNVEFSAKIQSLSKLVQLDPNRVEWEDLREMILFAMAKSEDLIGFMDADTFMFIVDAISALGAYTQYSVDTAWGEGNLQTARLDESIRAIIRTLGVRQRRKIPGSCSVRLSRPLVGGTTPALLIPAYTPFRIAGNAFFNREAVGFGPGESEIEVEVFEGSIVDYNFNNQTGDYARFVSEEGQFQVSDSDVRVFINGEPVLVTYDPVWLYENIDGITNYVVQDGTLSSGNLELKFGNAYFGYSPAVTDDIRISYVVTKGVRGRELQVISASVSVDGYSSISGTTLTVVSGGNEELSGEIYKNIGPMAFTSQRKAVDETGYKVAALNYPNIVDSAAIRQAYYAPDDLRYANFLRISLLTAEGTTMSDDIWEGFKAYLQPIGLKTAKYLRYDPTASIVNVSADVYISNNLSAETVRNSILRRLENVFRPRYGILQLDIFKSDIYENIMASAPGINHVVLNQPSADMINTLVYPTTNLDKLTTGSSTLQEGTYQYYLTIVTAQGESLPVALGSEAISAAEAPTARIRTSYGPLKFGNESKLYRVFTDTLGVVETKLINTAVSTVSVNFNDTVMAIGTVTELPKIDNSGVWYPKLGTVTLNIYSTNRQTISYRNVYE